MCCRPYWGLAMWGACVVGPTGGWRRNAIRVGRRGCTGSHLSAEGSAAHQRSCHLGASCVVALRVGNRVSNTVRGTLMAGPLISTACTQNATPCAPEQAEQEGHCWSAQEAVYENTSGVCERSNAYTAQNAYTGFLQLSFTSSAPVAGAVAPCGCLRAPARV